MKDSEPSGSPPLRRGPASTSGPRPFSDGVNRPTIVELHEPPEALVQIKAKIDALVIAAANREVGEWSAEFEARYRRLTDAVSFGQRREILRPVELEGTLDPRTGLPKLKRRTALQLDLVEAWLAQHDPHYQRDTKQWNGSMPKGVSPSISLEERLEDDERAVLDEEAALDPAVIAEERYTRLKEAVLKAMRLSEAVLRMNGPEWKGDLDALVADLDAMWTRQRRVEAIRLLERVRMRLCAAPDCDNSLSVFTHANQAQYCSETCSARHRKQRSREATVNTGQKSPANHRVTGSPEPQSLREAQGKESPMLTTDERIAQDAQHLLRLQAEIAAIAIRLADRFPEDRKLQVAINGFLIDDVERRAA